MDGEDWLRKSGDSTVKRWGDDGHDLFNSAIAASAKCPAALMGCQELKYFDMDGSSYIQSLVELAELGRSYLTNVPAGEGPTEPLHTALSFLRTKLSLVGFFNATVFAGRAGAESSHSHIVGGERALAEQLVQFRSAVRRNALEDIRNETATTSTKEILQLCDKVRDVILPSIGLELNNVKTGEEDENDGSSWRFCLPRLKAESALNDAKESEET
jgi:hypothetical protein